MELKDTQGLLIRGYAEWPEAAYIMLAFSDPLKTRLWLKKILPQITNGELKPELPVQLAFTHEGMASLLPGRLDDMGFSIEFIQGMATEYRQRLLGDTEESAASAWEWGGTEGSPVHACLMVFSRTEEALNAGIRQLETDWEEQGVRKIVRLDVAYNPHNKEHFGFRDGMSQPLIPGLSKTGAAENTVAAGEFILGYENGYAQLPDSPLVSANADMQDILPAAAQKKGFKDLGKNGSYMVFRQLEQDVASFWGQVKKVSLGALGAEDSSACIYFASKMVGRWPNGTPVVKSPGHETPFYEDEYFLYRNEKDEEGLKCPLGAHVRRANPRDVLPDNKAASSVEISNLHRILRRGRNYGTPLVQSMLPEDLMQAADDGKKRGLYFICFNTNIARQFEFIQHMWCNNTKFAGLYNDPDPLLGIKDERSDAPAHDFTIQAEPVRIKARGMERHVKMVGGGYFFMPGIRALRYLSENQTA